MEERDISEMADSDKILPKIEKSVLPRTHTAPGDGEHDEGYDKQAMAETGLAKKSIDYMMYLASASLGIMVMVLFLQGYNIGGFNIDAGALSTLLPSLSVASALNALGWVAGKALGGK